MSNKINKSDYVSLLPLTVKNISQNCHKWLRDPDVNRYLEVRHNPPKTIEAIIAFVQKCEKIRRHHWGVFVEGKHIGMVSCSDYNHKYKWVDISIVIGDKTYWKKGYAKQALLGAIEHLFSVGKFHRIQAGVYSVNGPCLKLFNKMGFVKEACLREAAKDSRNYVNIIKFGLLKSEWKPKRSDLSRVIVKKMKWE